MVGFSAQSNEEYPGMNKIQMIIHAGDAAAAETEKLWTVRTRLYQALSLGLSLALGLRNGYGEDRRVGLFRKRGGDGLGRRGPETPLWGIYFCRTGTSLSLWVVGQRALDWS